MAGTPCATFTFLSTSTIQIPHATPRRFRPKPLLSSTSFPSKRIKRKNHLRPKILKTLTKPFPTAPLPQIETTPLHNDTVYDTPLKEILSSEELEFDKVEEFNVSETVSSAGEYSDSVGKLSVKSVLKYSAYFLGVLLFQTICAVWLFGNADSEGKERNFNEKWNVLSDVNRNEVYVSESELEEKISEIKVMAREARERERRELIQGDKGSELEKEIGARLVKLEKRLNSKSEKLQDSFTEYLGLFGDFRDGSDSKEENKTLMFKKKFRFKSPSMDARSTPKCFSGLKDDSGVRKSGTDLNGLSRKTDVRSLKKDTGRKDGNVQLNSVKNNGNKVERKGANLRKESGSVHEIREVRPSNEDPEAGKSRDLETLNSESSTKENQETSIKAERPAATSSRNGSRDPGKRQLAYKFGDKQSDVQKDLWWSNLPYVLAILMRRGSEHEESGGLYALRVPSQVDKHGDFSYTIAFEDRGNADNFCYLLESVFEDLGDFSADIVPLQVKELHDAVKLHSKKVIVVKKGQLKLYAGQPFSEVEMALYSLFEQD
ncbi:ABC SUBFAMILY C PROTEIN [Salix koriyanagi]|uniref:ABC SUBFAMILY C PROTEIN n=1 Tax=Salix koriyanagi TaxID=2511006 RepID=A0A9Q0WNZ8_9ROSI|nr:ABC SUBFAMILY C PROTEIN [Salix koriyanagi]